MGVGMVLGLYTLLDLPYSSVLANGNSSEKHWGNNGYLGTELWKSSVGKGYDIFQPTYSTMNKTYSLTSTSEWLIRAVNLNPLTPRFLMKKILKHQIDSRAGNGVCVVVVVGLCVEWQMLHLLI